MKLQKTEKVKNICKIGLMAFLLLTFMSITAIQAGAINLSGPIQTAVNDVIGQFKGVIASVLTLISVVLVAVLIFKIVGLWNNYREGEQLHFMGLVITAVCLVISGTATGWMWTIVAQ